MEAKRRSCKTFYGDVLGVANMETNPMTEDEWVNSSNPGACLFDHPSSRKRQLFSVACFRHAIEPISDAWRQRLDRMAGFYSHPQLQGFTSIWDVCRDAIDVAERQADELAYEDEWDAILERAREAE